MLLRAGGTSCAKFETGQTKKKKYGCVALRVVQIVIIKTTEVQISRLSQMTCTEPPLLIAYSNVVFTG